MNDLRADNYFAILEGKKVVVVKDSAVWSRFFEDEDKRRLAETYVGDLRVSTVFLGINHGWGRDEPLWFETMVFKTGDTKLRELNTKRYTTWDEAIAGHDDMVVKLRRKHLAVVQ